MTDPPKKNAEREERLRRSWDANAGAWAEVVREGRIESRRLATDAAIVEAVAALSPRRVLDVGCGEGWLARALVGSGVDVVGVDGSEALIRRARELGGGEFLVAGYPELVRNPAVAGGSYDAVVCNFALLGEEIAELLLALRRRLAPQGRLLIQTVHPWSVLGDEPYRDGWRTEGWQGFAGQFPEPMPWFFRTLGSWIRCLGEAGLAVDEVREPLHPGSGRPLSLLLRAAPRARL